MKPSGTKQQPSQALLWGVVGIFVLVIAGYGYYSIYGFSSTPAPPVARSAPPAVTSSQPAANSASHGAGSRPAAGVKANSAVNLVSVGQYDPTLHMDAMDVTESLEYAGSGRNIFSVNSAPPPMKTIPTPVASVRPLPPVVSGPPPPQLPLPPPPIDLKFFGMETASSGKHQAFVLHGDDVWVASEGEIVARRYKIVSIGNNSITVEDMPNNNRQNIPIEVQ